MDMENSNERPRRGLRAAAAYWLPLLFISASLISLVAVPVIVDRMLEEREAYLENTLEPSLRLIEEIRFLKARQFSSVQGFVLTRDPRFRDEYRRFDDRLLDVREDLGRILELAPTTIRARLADIDQPTTLWTFNHLRVLNEEVALDETGADFVTNDRALFEEALEATDLLRRAVTDERRTELDALERRRALQFPISAGLLILAGLAVVGVAVLGRRLNLLVQEVEQRRGEAVRSRRQSEAVMAASADGIIGIDLAGRATFVNRAGRRLLDYSDREILGRDVHDLILYMTPDRQTFRREDSPILQALRTGAEATLPESFVWRRDGSPLPVKLQLRPLIDGREVKGAVMTFTDVTQERDAAEALRSAIRARDEVLAVVSHDLRNPVGTVFSASDLLLEVELPPERVREHLAIIKRSASTMNRLIQDLLDVARIEAGGLSVEPVKEEVWPILEEACQMALPLASNKNVRLSLEDVPSLPPVVADRDRVLQVLSNLIGNALKFTPAGGEVVMDALAESGMVRIRVSDTGPGIPAEDHEHVFTRFWQVKRSDRGGAGLGLAIVKGIVEAHGGVAEVHDRSGQGSVFSFTLPVSP